MTALLVSSILLFLLVRCALAEQECQSDWQTLALQADKGRSSFLTWQPDCYSFDVTSASDDKLTEMTVTKQVKYGEGYPKLANKMEVEENDSLRTILDFYDLIESYCLDDCPDFQVATECRVTFDAFRYADPDTPGALLAFDIPHTVEIDMLAGDKMIRYSLTNFFELDCAEEVETGIVFQPMFGEVCHEWQDVQNAYDPALSSWEQNEPDCYEFTWQWFGQVQVEPVVSRLINGQVVSGRNEYLRQSMSITDFYALINDKCVKDCPDSGAYQCRVEYDTLYTYNSVANIVPLLIPKFISIDEINIAIDDEVSYQISDFTAIHCDSPGDEVGDETTAFRNSSP